MEHFSVHFICMKRFSDKVYTQPRGNSRQAREETNVAREKTTSCVHGKNPTRSLGSATCGGCVALFLGCIPRGKLMLKDSDFSSNLKGLFSPGSRHPRTQARSESMLQGRDLYNGLSRVIRPPQSDVHAHRYFSGPWRPTLRKDCGRLFLDGL